MQYVILNLARNTERWSRMEEQAARIGLPVRRIEAIDGEALTPLELQRLYSPELNRRQFHRPLVPGEIGCYASHREAWRQLLASADEAFVVFEDDVVLEPQLRASLDAITALPVGWDMIKLIGRQREKPLCSHAFVSGADLVSYRRVPSLTGAYVISRSGAQKLLRHRLPFGRPVDVDLRHWWECDLRVFGLLPYPVREAPLAQLSTIRGRTTANPPLGARLKKLELQLQYTARNWWALHRPWSPHPQAITRYGEAAELRRFFNR